MDYFGYICKNNGILAFCHNITPKEHTKKTSKMCATPISPFSRPPPPILMYFDHFAVFHFIVFITICYELQHVYPMIQK